MPDDPAPPVFTEIEQKILRLGLDPAAQPGEVDACAVQLFRSLRRRGSTAEEIIRRSAQTTWRAREIAAARGYVVPFGRYRGKTVGELPANYRGKTVGELPANYIRWALTKCDNLSFNLRKAMRLVLENGK